MSTKGWLDEMEQVTQALYFMVGLQLLCWVLWKQGSEVISLAAEWDLALVVMFGIDWEGARMETNEYSRRLL